MPPPATANQQEKCKIFHDLHHTGKLLVLPNIWDPLGAILLESLGYPCVATASASVAFANGYDDGERIPFKDLLNILQRIVNSVNIPVSADVESGYAADNDQLVRNARQLIDTGITGINFEDTAKETNTLLPVEAQCEKIRLIRKTAGESGIPLFINARTDVFIRGTAFPTPESKIEETIKRGMAYKAAGADGFFPIALYEKDHIKKVVDSIEMPVNISLLPGAPSLSEMELMGVARVSMGPSLLKFAIKAMQDIVLKLQKHEGGSELAKNEITTAYMKKLVNKN